MSDLTASAAGWTAVSASVRGAAHDRTGRPNEDAVAVRALEGSSPCIVAAVADGHGGQRYVRSSTGARLAVEIALDAVARWWPAVTGLDQVAVAGSAREALVPEIVAGWRQATAAHVDREPFEPDEHEAAGVDLAEAPTVAYGATLLLAVVATDRLFLLQLGDGDIIVSGPGGATSPVPSDDRLVGGQTTSLCLDGAERDFRVQVDGGAEVDLVVVSSDGYGNSFAAAGWRDEVARDLRERIASRGAAEMAVGLPDWLAASAAAGGDDVTVVVLSRPPAEQVPVKMARADAAATVSTSTAVRRERRLPLLALVAVVFGLVALGVLAGRASVSTHAAAPSATVETTAISSSTVATTGVTSPTVTLAPRAPIRMGTARGHDIEFVPDPKSPGAQELSTDDQAAISRLTIAGATWQLSPSGTLQQVSNQGTRVIATGVIGGSLLWAGPYIWVADPAGTVLAAVDPSSGAVVGRSDVAPPPATDLGATTSSPAPAVSRAPTTLAGSNR